MEKYAIVPDDFVLRYPVKITPETPRVVNSRYRVIELTDEEKKQIDKAFNQMAKAQKLINEKSEKKLEG